MITIFYKQVDLTNFPTFFKEHELITVYLVIFYTKIYMNFHTKLYKFVQKKDILCRRDH